MSRILPKQTVKRKKIKISLNKIILDPEEKFDKKHLCERQKPDQTLDW